MEEDEENRIMYDSDTARIILERAEFYVDMMNDYFRSEYVELYRALSVVAISDVDLATLEHFGPMT